MNVHIACIHVMKLASVTCRAQKLSLVENVVFQFEYKTFFPLQTGTSNLEESPNVCLAYMKLHTHFRQRIPNLQFFLILVSRVK